MKTYEVVLLRTQSSKAVVELKAETWNQAMQQAHDLEASDVDDWNPYDSSVDVCTITEIKNQVTEKEEKKG